MAEADDTAGDRKPPKAGQFKKGQSGNPGGKRKRPLSLSEELLVELNRKVPLVRHGKMTKEMISHKSITIKMLVKAAASGDLRAVNMVLNREADEIARMELRPAKLAEEAEAAAIARGEREPRIMKFTLCFPEEEQRALEEAQLKKGKP